jgi:hypothetical protein
MTEPVEPKPEYRSLTEDAVIAALQDPDPANPIAVEVARLIDGYTSNFHAHVRRLGHIPADILRAKPRWPIEAVAMRLVRDTVRETFAQTTAGEES